MGVVGIKQIQNDSDSKLVYERRERHGENTDIANGADKPLRSAISWVKNEHEFNTRAIVIRDITESKNLCYIWQRDVSGIDRVRMSTTGWEDPGQPIPGNSSTEKGDRNLIIDSNKNIRLE